MPRLSWAISWLRARHTTSSRKWAQRISQKDSSRRESYAHLPFSASLNSFNVGTVVSSSEFSRILQSLNGQTQKRYLAGSFAPNDLCTGERSRADFASILIKGYVILTDAGWSHANTCAVPWLKSAIIKVWANPTMRTLLIWYMRQLRSEWFKIYLWLQVTGALRFLWFANSSSTNDFSLTCPKVSHPNRFNRHGCRTR